MLSNDLTTLSECLCRLEDDATGDLTIPRDVVPHVFAILGALVSAAQAMEAVRVAITDAPGQVVSLDQARRRRARLRLIHGGGAA